MSTRDVIEPIENPDEPTIQEAVREYLRVAGLNHTTNTVNNIRSQVVRFGTYLGALGPIGGVTSRDVENYTTCAHTPLVAARSLTLSPAAIRGGGERVPVAGKLLRDFGGDSLPIAGG